MYGSRVMPRKNTGSPPDATHSSGPKNDGENAAVNDPDIDAHGEKRGKSGAKPQRAEGIDRGAKRSLPGSC